MSEVSDIKEAEKIAQSDGGSLDQFDEHLDEFIDINGELQVQSKTELQR